MAMKRLMKILEVTRKRYERADRTGRGRLLDEFCSLSGYHRKYAIALLGTGSDTADAKERRRRGVSYPESAVRVIERIWEAAGFPWSVRLHSLLRIWMPWARQHVRGLDKELEEKVLSISARQIDRRLSGKKRKLKRRLYGRTKPGTLLKHLVPVKAGPWEVAETGYAEIDLVSHSGPSAKGEFAYTLNVTEVVAGWCESRAILGRSEAAVVAALDKIRKDFPIPLRGINSDNGSEFLNYHMVRYCQRHCIQFTRGRPYKKDDNARIEQKNWTHVRRLVGWDRYDTHESVNAMNELYSELKLMMNLYQPSVRLIERRRVGSRLRRHYDTAKTPLDRLIALQTEPPPNVRRLADLRQRLDPFELSESIGRKLEQLFASRTGVRTGATKASSGIFFPAPLGGQETTGGRPCPVRNQMSL